MLTDSGTGNLLGSIAVRPAKGHSPQGMRFVEILEWLSRNTLMVGGSVNPSTVEYATFDVRKGQEVGGAFCDGFSINVSPDGQHLACLGYIPYGTRPEDRQEYVEVDGKRAFPTDGESVTMLSNPVWSEDGTQLGFLDQRQTGEQEAVVLHGSAKPYRAVLGGENFAKAVKPFWDSGILYIENGDAITSVDPSSDIVSESVLAASDSHSLLFRRPSRIKAARESLVRAARRLGGSQPDFFTVR